MAASDWRSGRRSLCRRRLCRDSDGFQLVCGFGGINVASSCRVTLLLLCTCGMSMSLSAAMQNPVTVTPAMRMALPAEGRTRRMGDSKDMRQREKPMNGWKTATFAMGSFWMAEAVFACYPGVLRTRVGYAGGTRANPDYYHMGDHAEAVQIDYDPTVISYEQLLEIFWASHNPVQSFGQGPDVGRQYRAIVFTRSTYEESLASESKKEVQERHPNDNVRARVVKFESFTVAEPFHQKFELKRRPQLFQLVAHLTDAELLNSKAAAELNAYASGFCPPAIKRMRKLEAKLRPLIARLRELDTSFLAETD
ncbi:hypothetical protein CBR_g40629 [Chara braunii]|uniref:Peptide methionine sulfoxide reductase A5 n=1 Tax=Chara braunii TaxID=69332 RepID=A0A388LU84_CHABU|nr:hypothetical protein CBR_g40629 [Chara braunii]|eukprot:GBG85819.1 hypothetical protein CBR_g40629 [Chara braunii]